MIEIPSRNEKRDWLWAAALSALFALSAGVIYGFSDAAEYLLLGHRLADPSFLTNDWFTWRTSHHHYAFGYFVWFLSFFGNLPVMTGLAHLLNVFALGLALYWILKRLTPEPLGAFVIALLLTRLAVGRPFLSCSLLPVTLLPTNLATALFVGGLGALLSPFSRREIMAGVLFGLSGLIHANFLFLIPPFLAVLFILDPRRSTKRGWTVMTLLFLVTCSPTLWISLREFIFAPGGESLQAKAVLVNIRSPHHYRPSDWPIKDFTTTFGLTALGGFSLLRRRKESSCRDFLTLFTALLIVLSAGVFFTTVIPLQPVILLFPFRLAPVAVVLSLVAVATAKETDRQATLLAVIALVLLGIPPQGALAPFVILLALFTAGLIFAANPKRRTILTALAFTALSAAALTLLPNPFWNNHPLDARQTALFEWVRTQTPEDSVFVVPLTMEDFRLHARRAVVVDWKCFSVQEEEAREWLARVRAVAGREEIRSLEEAMAGYGAMNLDRARDLQARYGAEYVITAARTQDTDLTGLERVYADDFYRVGRIHDLGQ